MADLQLNQVRNRFIGPIDLKVADGDLLVIVGPSGAGKTSLLKVIAGLAPHSGIITANGRDIHHLPPYRRALGYVSQEHHLFPHMTLEGNLDIAMDRLGWDKRRRRERISELITLLRIGHLSGRRPPTFSAGERQRAALARVLASEPRMLLMDEPFSNLDFRTARYLRSEFKQLQKQLHLTSILVTHNMDEARELADVLAVMRQGQLMIAGSPARWLENHQSTEDSFLEAPNLLEAAQACPLGNGLIEIHWAGLRLYAPDDGCGGSCITIDAREVEIGSDPPPGPPINRFQGRIHQATIRDDTVQLVLDIAGTGLRVELTPDKWRKLGLTVKDLVHVFVRIRAFEVR